MLFLRGPRRYSQTLVRVSHQVFKHLYRWLKAFGFASFNNPLLYFLDLLTKQRLCITYINDNYNYYFLSVRSLDITPTIYMFCLSAKNFKLGKISAKKTFLYTQKTKKKTEKILNIVCPLNYTTDNI